MHARRAILPVVLLAAFALVHCARREPVGVPIADDSMPPPGHMVAVADAPGSIEELQRRIAVILERENVPGTAIALVGRDGPIWVGGVGVRNRETGAPMQSDTVFRVGSLTKSIIALGVMRLVDQGKLDVDRPLREILPDVPIDNPWDDVAPVTLAHCMEHTAGLDEVRFNEIFTDDEDLPVRDTLAINPRSKRVRWRPGTRHAYSNVGFTLAARAIEVATGEPFDQYLRREVMLPLGITDADFRRTDSIRPRLATGYGQNDAPAEFLPFAHRPSGALLASASDLGKLVHFWIRRGEGYPPIVSAAGLARIEHSGTLPYPRTQNEYGFANYGDVQHPALARGHDGGMPGFHASIRYFPGLDVGYVMLLNANYSFQGYYELRSLLFAYLTKGRAFPPPPAAADSERPGADYFAYASPRNVVFGFIDQALIGWHVSDAGENVRLRDLDGTTDLLVPTEDGGYRLPWECGSSIRFTTNLDGTPVMITSFLYAEAASGEWRQLGYDALGFAMLLVKYAPLWAVIMLTLGFVQRRRFLPLSLVIWPAIAGLTCVAMPHLLDLSFDHAVIGELHPLTVAITGVTILFAVASAATLVASIYWAWRPDRPRLRWRLFPALCAIAFSGLSIWLAANHLIGIRTWSW